MLTNVVQTPERPIPYTRAVLDAVREAAANGEAHWGLRNAEDRKRDRAPLMVSRDEFLAFVDDVEAGKASPPPEVGVDVESSHVIVTRELLTELEATAKAGGPVDH